MKIGDKVSVLDDNLSGIVSSIEFDKVIIVTEDDFEMEFNKNDLIVMDNSLSRKDFVPDDVSRIISENEERKNLNKKRVNPKDRSLPPLEVDLHIHQLVPKTKGLDKYEMLTIQIDTAKRQLDFAIRKRIPRVVFIHGVGEGVLRAELEFLFKRYDNLQYNDADFQKYGRGATEVYIFQNKKP